MSSITLADNIKGIEKIPTLFYLTINEDSDETKEPNSNQIKIRENKLYQTDYYPSITPYKVLIL